MTSLTETVLLGLASARGTHLVVKDSITAPLRERLDTWHMNGVRPGRTNRLRTFVLDLMSCVLCFGFWVSVLTLAAYLTATGWTGWNVLSFGVAAFAVAAVQVTTNLAWLNLMGGDDD